jgi:hypothetical protein
MFTPRNMATNDIVLQGDDCPARNKGPHLHTSAFDLGKEFYPCICGRKFDPSMPFGAAATPAQHIRRNRLGW